MSRKSSSAQSSSSEEIFFDRTRIEDVVVVSSDDDVSIQMSEGPLNDNDKDTEEIFVWNQPTTRLDTPSEEIALEDKEQEHDDEEAEYECGEFVELEADRSREFTYFHMSWEGALALFERHESEIEDPSEYRHRNIELIWTSNPQDGVHPAMVRKDGSGKEIPEPGAVYIKRNYVDDKRCAVLLEDIREINGFDQEIQTRRLSEKREALIFDAGIAWYIPADEDDEYDSPDLDIEPSEPTDDEAEEELAQQRAREREEEQPTNQRTKRPRVIVSDSE